MAAGADELVEVAAEAVGRCEAADELSWPHGESRVIELRCADGSRLAGKAHRRAHKFRAELDAYRNWVPALAHQAPRLIAACETRQVLILSWVEGEIVTANRHRAQVAWEAGQLLRRFHGSVPPQRMSGFITQQEQRVEQWLSRARPGLLTPAEIHIAYHHLEALREFADPLGVPCHRDWHGRNWLLNSDGVLHVIDFEHARIAPWHDDLHRLWWNEWRENPDLADAFFDGYGQSLSDDDARAMQAASMIGHVITIVWADEHHDEAYGEFARQCLAADGEHQHRDSIAR